MACINIMFNPDQQQYSLCPPMSPRISFSSDFLLDPPPPSAARADRASDPDFEFAVGGRPMMAADELFFKGRMLPLRGGAENNSNNNNNNRRMTLRDELRAQDEVGPDAGRPPKGSSSSSIRWKELLGLKKPHYGGGAVVKKGDREVAEASGSKSSSQELNGVAAAKAKDTERWVYDN